MSLGKIATWDDPALAQANPGVPLPNLPVTVVRRSDGSGTTYLWTDYLSAVSVEWRTRVGTTAEPDWPATRFLPARGNDGTAREVKRTPGAFGYLDLNAALAPGLTVGAIENRHGTEVRPSVATVRAALDSYGSDLPADLRASLIDRPGRESYPIVGATWVVVYERQPPGKADALRDFLKWIVTDGQAYAEEYNSPGIPAALRPGLDDLIGRITDQPIP
jgi:phosphate transport system substrate-binding protein